ncbi:MAG: PQQ-dependent sugar dehydrogenase, partial [Acidimicrobiia bacterium]
GMDPGVGVTNAIIVERSPTPGSAAAARVQFQGSPDKTLTARDLDAALGLKSQQIFSIEVPGTVDPPAASGPLVHSSHLVDDGVNGDSVGNGDGYAQCGETIELYVDLRNTGTGTLSGINAVLVIDSPNLDLLYNAGSDFPDAAPGSSVASIDDWDLAVDPDIVGNPVVELQLIVSATGAGSWFETFTMQIFCGGFADIAGSGFATEIDWLADQGITQGCNPPENSLFCPGEDVTRAQMATFLTRALDLPAAAESQFTDVAGSVHAASIESLREAGITSGCNPPANDRFCPTDNVTRAQMATFLSRALGLAPSDDDGPFTDHTVSVHRRAINAIRIAGITSGCNPPANDHYCPGDNVTRAQMAAFLGRTLGLEPMIPPPRPEVAVEVFASGLDAPIFVDAPPGDDRVFIVEKGGRILIASGGTVITEPFLDIQGAVLDSGERGLFAVAFHPDYAANGRFFVHYSAVGSGDTIIEEYRAEPAANTAAPSPVRTILRVTQPASNHNGGMIEFGPDGYLYIALGDGGGGGDPWENGQNPSTLLGAILRVDIDGISPYAIPPSNPYTGGGGRPEVFHWGLRNPWRFGFDPATGDLYIADVGQSSWEEIDVAPAGNPGLNFGWNTMEGSHCFDPSAGCSTGGVELPVVEYDHSQGCSITGGYVYRGSGLAALAGHYFYSDACSGWIRSLRWDGSGVAEQRDWTPELGTFGSVWSFGTDGRGELYFVAGDTVYRFISG